MGKEELWKQVIVALVLVIVSNHQFANSQNLSKYYGQSCDFKAAQKDPNVHIKQCNADLEPPSEKYLYVLLVCNGGTCQCPDLYSIRGRKLNATGYEWKEEKAQCLLSAESECGGLTKDLCASGKCADGKCFNVTRTRVGPEDDNHGNGLTATILVHLTTIFLPIINHFAWI